MATKAPFAAPDVSKRRMRVLVTGDPKTGKTRLALSFPNVALIESEAGSDWHIEHVAPFQSVRTQSLDVLDDTLEWLRDNKHEFQTVVIDSITVFRDEETFRLRGARGEKFGYQERARVNERLDAVYNALQLLPMHVVVIARQDDLYATENGTLKRVGRGLDASKSAAYGFDFVLRMNERGAAVVEYSRAGGLPAGHVVENPSYQRLARALDSRDLGNANVAKAFVARWSAESITTSDLLKALSEAAGAPINRLSEWTAGETAADDAVRTYIVRMTSAPSAGK